MDNMKVEYVPMEAKVCGRCDAVHPLGGCVKDKEPEQLELPGTHDRWTEEDERIWEESIKVKKYTAPQNVLRSFPDSAEERKQIPITTGVLDYFPLAIAEIARVSKAGNDQHNPGQPLHWARGKSVDHADCITRHLIQRGTPDTDGMRHSAKMAWRALALLQEELEKEAGFDAN